MIHRFFFPGRLKTELESLVEVDVRQRCGWSLEAGYVMGFGGQNKCHQGSGD